MNKEGPHLHTIPETKQMVCNGCKYLKIEAWVRGHKTSSDNYGCMHPEIKKDIFSLIGNEKTRVIFSHHEGAYCNTPLWCPYLQTKI